MLSVIGNRYNYSMMKKKYENSKKKYCFFIVSLLIVSGCSTQDKREEILHIQKRRIHSLEQELSRKQKEIDSLKQKEWMYSGKTLQQGDFLKLKNLVAEKKWIEAVKESANLKRKFPESIQLRKYRFKIFEEMGLKKQAKRELQEMQGLRKKVSKRSDEN